MELFTCCQCAYLSVLIPEVSEVIKWPTLEGVHYVSISFSIVFFVKEAQQNILSFSEHFLEHMITTCTP